MKKRDNNKIVLILALVIYIGFLIGSLTRVERFGHIFWEADVIAAILITTGVYLIRKKIRLIPTHFILIVLFFILHLLGIFGAYTWTPLGIEFDVYMHGFFGFVSALIIYHAHKFDKIKQNWKNYVIVIIFILGIGALHEIVELLGALIVGSGEGFIGFGPGDFGELDTQMDLLSNFSGGILGLLIYFFLRLRKKKK